MTTYSVPNQKPPPPPDLATTPPSTGDSESESLSDVPMTDDGSYEVIAPPVGATVPYLPDEAKEKTIGDKKYWMMGETYYQAFVSGGDTIYMVVEEPKSA